VASPAGRLVGIGLAPGLDCDQSVAKGMTVAADRPAIRRELRDDAAVTMGEPFGRLHDTCTARLPTARTARIMLIMSQQLQLQLQLQSLTGADGDGGADVLHLCGEVPL
jgi:hypothetical protein